MKKINEILAVILLALAAVLVAAIGFRAYDSYMIDRQEKQERREQEQVLSRNREAHDRVLEMRREIEELSADRESLLQFLEEIRTTETEVVIPVSMMVEAESGMTGGLPESDMTGERLESGMTLLSEDMTDASIDTASVSENGVFAANDLINNEENTTIMSWNVTTVSDNMMNVSGNDAVTGMIPNLAENDTISEDEVSLSGNDGDSVSGNEVSLSGNDDDSVSGNEVSLSGNDSDSVSGNEMSLSGNDSDSVSGNEVSLSGNDSDSVSGNEVSLSGNDSDSVSGNEVNLSGNDSDSISGNMPSLSGNDTPSANAVVSGNMTDLLPKIEMVTPEITLAERRQICSSLEETLLVNQEDKTCLEERRLDFSDKKIACLGDSITAAANLEGQENYPACSYPAVLQELLGAEEVVNLGIGGSTIGRYWSSPFVERYREIPQDTDIIIVMGGTNDGFCLSQKEFGTLTERKPWTFCGDLDELMRGLKENYPNADIFFVTPLPNILHDYLMRERTYLLPQNDLVNVILTLAAAYDFHVIDLYNANLLDSHDADIVTDYMPDGVHANETGYRILAEHIAAEIVRQEEAHMEGIMDTLQ